MKFSIISVLIILLGGISFAQELAIKDPQNMKIDQIKKGITKLIGEIQHQNDRMAIFEQQLNENQASAALQESFAEMKEDMIETEQRLKKNIDELIALTDNLGDGLSELSEQNDRLSALQADTENRLSKIEDYLIGEDTKKRIPRQSDGSAKVFRLNTMGEYADQLPDADQCNKLGEVLENEMDRSLNALFVMSDDNSILLCELEYGRTEWSLSQASLADRAHVITKE